jgi:C1q domain
MPFLGNEPSNTFVSIAKQTITGNGGTSYALSYPVASANDIDVFYNNVRQEPGVAYTASGSTIAFTEAIASTDSVYILYNGQAIGTVNAPEGAYLPTTGGTLNGQLSVNNKVVIQQDSGSNNRLTLRGKPSSSYRWNIDNFDSANTLRIFKENDSDGSAGAVMAEINSSGIVTMPYQPAFRAIKSATVSGTSENPVQYDVVDYNIGSHYNNSTYRFTAPVAGRYFVTCQFSFYVPGDARQVEVGIKKNGTVIQSGDCFMQVTQSNNTHITVTISAILNLSANDYVQGAYISSTASVTFYSSSSRNTFQGYLIG